MIKFFTKKKLQGWLSVEPSEQSTQLTHVLKNNGHKPMVKMTFSQVNNKDAFDVQSIIADIDLDIDSYHCTMLIKQGEYQIFQIEKPNVPDNELKQAISWKLKDMIDYPVEQATIDIINIPADDNKSSRQSYVYAVSAKNVLIGHYMQKFTDAAKLGLEVIDIPEMAQRNIAAYIEEENRGLALLSINKNGGLLTFTANKALYHARQIELNTEALSSDNSEQKSNIFERFALEIQRSLDNFERQFPQLAINRLVLAPFVGREDFYDYLTSYLYIKVERLDLADIFDFEGNAKLNTLESQALFFPALGAALRDGDEL
ncbi:MAG: agglutinin biogenesis protein MshI [Methylotenera sp.]|uniref:agglutinin biogenesis protein MshI n=1 Tax=Methylotenera sp. TaxID=2051956 RepID=UPI00271ED8CF|nr:agglutinin biogenesis protein MshI [Methylotenera sp.]MDO9150386.1 agglutinin biogenesis protein MshI [Methylotenera sp.]